MKWLLTSTQTRRRSSGMEENLAQFEGNVPLIKDILGDRVHR